MDKMWDMGNMANLQDKGREIAFFLKRCKMGEGKCLKMWDVS